MRLLVTGNSFALPVAGQLGFGFFESADFVLSYHFRHGRWLDRLPGFIYPRLLAEQLAAESGGAVELEILARPWWTLVEARALLPRIRRWRPDLVVLHYGLCDCQPNVYTRRMRKAINLTPRFLNRRFNRLEHRLRRAGLTNSGEEGWLPPPEFEMRFAELLAELQRDPGAPLAAVNIAQIQDAVEAKLPGYRRNIQNHNAALGRAAAARSVPVIDAFELLGLDNENFWEDGCHYSETGHRRMAEAIFENWRRSGALVSASR